MAAFENHRKGKRMSFKKILLLMGLSVFLAACSTGRLAGDAANPHETATDMGVKYLLGRGVPRNDTKAFYYFSQGAKQDDPFAQNELAYMYATGKGTTRDYGKAFTYYQLAADHHLASAQYNLGLLYWHGLGVGQNKVVAREWFHRSAAQGFLPAKKMLAHS
jgi:TPR repeat protein